MRMSFFWLMILCAATLGWIAPSLLSGSESANNVSDKVPAGKVSPEDDRNNVKAGDKKVPSESGIGVKGDKREASEDRPWIIKQRARGTSVVPEKKVKPFKWNNEEQRVQCDTLLKGTQESLNKARTYSVRGDTCATAKHAKNFADLVSRCKNECPEGFLESKGYSEKILRNVSVLLELGKKACLD